MDDRSSASVLGELKPRSIVVFRALQLGDLLCTVPVFRALRSAFPDAKITLAGLPWAGAFVRRFSRYIDDFIPFPGYPGLPECVPDIRRIPRFFASVQNRRFDLAIQLHGSGSVVNPVTALLGARRSAGFYTPGDYRPDQQLFMPYPDHGHEIRRNLRLMEFLGIPTRGEHLEFPLNRADEHELASLPEAAGLSPGKYVCVHAGSRSATRRWLPERFAETADRIVRNGHTVVLTGSLDELELVKYVSLRMREPHINLAGRTGLGALGILLRNARLLVTNDTAVSHIGTALNTPAVVIVTGSEPRRWAPLNRNLTRTAAAPVPCRPCSFSRCPLGRECATGIRTDDVMEMVDTLAGKEWSHAA